MKSCSRRIMAHTQRALAALAALGGLTLAQPAAADLEMFPDRSLEWLVDTSDVIVVAKVQGRGDDEKLHIERRLKPAGGNPVAAPERVGELECLGCIPSRKFTPLREPGDRLLLFARRAADRQPRVHHLIYLRAAAVNPSESGSYKDACRGIYRRAGMALYGNTANADAERVCAVLNIHGEILVDPDFVIACVKQRVAAGPTVPSDANVEKLEHFFVQGADDAYGGFYAGSMPMYDYTPWADSWAGSECYFILVPPEPQFRSAAFAALTEKYQNVTYARPALKRLANYPHDGLVIQWLQTYLREGKPEKVETRTVDGKKQSDLLRAEVEKTIESLLARGAKLPQASPPASETDQ